MKHILFCSIFLFASCSTMIKSGNTLYKANLSTGGSGVYDNLEIFKVTEKFKGKVKIEGDRAIITPEKSIVATSLGKVSLREIPIDGVRPTKSGVYYYSNDLLLNDTVSQKFKYKETSFAVQGLAVALKIRDGQEINGTKFPYQVESGSSYGIGGAYKVSWNSFNKNKNIWGSNLNSFSITSGPFLALGSASVKKSTNAPNLAGQDFSGLVWSPGVFVQFGYNNINVGWALGTDKLFGEGSSSWIYDGKIWNGLIVSINIAKF